MAEPLFALALSAAALAVLAGGRRGGAHRLRAIVRAEPGTAVVGVPVLPVLAASEVAVLSERLAALTRAGLPLTRSWAVLADTDQEFAPHCAVVAHVVQLGGSAADGLREVGPRGTLPWLAVACDASQTAGAPIGDVLDGVAGALRADEEARRQRVEALAGPRATATVLLWLPAAGVVLAALTGANPVTALFGSAPGRACLITGGALWLAGRWWMRRLLRAADRSAGPR